jgi:hypothetical protein
MKVIRQLYSVPSEIPSSRANADRYRLYIRRQHLVQNRFLALSCTSSHTLFRLLDSLKEALNKSFDKLRTNGKILIPFVVSLSNHERNPLVQSRKDKPLSENNGRSAGRLLPVDDRQTPSRPVPLLR